MKKKDMTKLGAYVLSAALLMSSLAACGSMDTEEASSPILPEETTEAETIVTEALTSSVGSGSAVSAGEEAKEETVYIFTNASGEQTSVLVNEKLKNISGTETIEDFTTLTDIENLTGDETYTTGDGDAITWDYAGSDITYRGTTTEETPVSIKVTYYLNDAEISPEELAGQSGEVRIRFDYTNNEKREITVNGETKEVYVPFTVMTGMLLDSEHFSNIEVTNGSVSEMSSGNLVVGVAVPGLSESLNLDSYGDDGIDLDIPEYFEVTATATDFELDMTMSVVSSGLMSDVDTDDLTLDDLTESLDDLKDATAELIDGTAELADGTQELKDGTQELADGAQDLKDGTQELADGAQDLKDGTQELADGASTLKDGTQTLADSMPTLTSGVTQLDDGAGSLSSGAKQVDAGAASLKTGIDTLAESVKTSLVPGVAQLATGAAQLDTGVNTLVNTVSGMGTSIDAAKTSVVEQANSQLESSGVTVDTIDAAILELESQRATYFELLSKSDADIYATQDQTNNYDASNQDMVDAVSKVRSQCITGISQIDAAIKTLVAAQAKVAGATEALDGVKSQISNEETTNSLAALTTGSAQLSAGLAQLQSSIGTFEESDLAPATAEGGTATICSGLYQLQNGAAQLSSGTSSLSSGADSLKNGTSSLKSSSEVLVNGVNSLNSGAGTLKDGADSLNSGAGTLKDGVDSLNSGAGDLKSGADELNDGAGELNDGAIELRDGMKEYDEDGIQKLTDLVDEDATELLDTFKAIVELGQNYQSFAGKPDTLDGSVVFIYRMDGISREDE